MTKRKRPAWWRWDDGWDESDGDNTCYCVWDNLGKDAIVFDVGAYEGEWIRRMAEKYGDYQFYAFEPAPRAFEVARKRLSGFANVSLYNFGLGNVTRTARLYDAQRDAATFLQIGGVGIDAEIMNIREFLDSEGIDRIALMSLNIEGGEFELLPYIISSNIVRQIERMMIQWHSVVKNSGRIQLTIQDALARTHAMTWNHGTWEAWHIKQ